MNFKKTALLCLVLAVFFSITASAASVEVVCKENKVAINVPPKFKYITKNDVDRNSDYFASFPISKNDAIDRINNNGVVIDAFSTEKDREIKISVTSGDFSKGIINFTPLSDIEKQNVANKLAAVAKKQGHTLLDTPQVVRCDKYSFVKYSARVGNTESGHIYTKIITIIGSQSYEVVCYNADATLNNEIAKANDEVFDSLRLKIKGDAGEIANNTFMMVVSVAIVLISAAFIVFSTYNLIKYAVKKHNSAELVKLKKRD